MLAHGREKKSQQFSANSNLVEHLALFNASANSYAEWRESHVAIWRHPLTADFRNCCTHRDERIGLQE